MNYEQNIKYSFGDLPLPSRNDAVILLANSNTYIEIPDFQGLLESEGYDLPLYDELLMFASSYARSVNNNYNMLGLLYHPYYVDAWDATGLFVASDIDFVTIHCDFTGLYISNADMDDAFNSAFVERSEPYVYPLYNYDDTYTSYTYGRYGKTITQSNQKLTFDYSVLKNNYFSGSNYQELHNRDNQIGYNYTFLSLNGTPSQDGFYLDFGSPLHDLYKSGWQSGYQSGFSGGYTQGTHDGFIQGQNSQGLDQVNATPFTYIGTAFNVVSDVLSLEVLPNVTLGLCFSIPLVFTLIMVLFKLIRK